MARKKKIEEDTKEIKENSEKLEEDIKKEEVKSEENLQAKSLKVYKEKFDPKIAIRSSMSDFRNQDWLTNLPLYALSEIDSVCQ